MRHTTAGLLVLLLGTPALAQTLTGITAAKNAGNSADQIFVDLANSYERESAVAITSATATSFTSRYAALCSADAGVFGGPLWEVLAADYSLSFTVNAPGAYRLTVQTRRKGDLHLVEDNLFAGGHYADITALTGMHSGGTLTAGGLGLADPGVANDIPLFFDPISVPFDQTASATLFGVSNGAGMAHALTFTWSQTAHSPAGADEAAIRLGGTSDDGSEVAADYPGNPARVQADDGHFVTVTLTSLCGNGVVDSGPSYAEQCDAGALTGTPASCCTATCTLRNAGAACRPAAGPCDSGETCSGVSGACPADAFAPPAVLCRAASAGEACDVDDYCDGGSAGCPADAVAASGTPCRAAAGVCDVRETCDGVATACPADSVVSDGTPCADGQFCNGAETCQAGACADAPNPCGGGCDEGVDQCFVGACAPQPQPCRAAAQGLLLLKDSNDDGRDRLLWKWGKGASTSGAEFGDPTAAADYALCLYAGAPGTLLGAAEIAASATTWKPLGALGYAYSDSTGAAGGVQKIKLKGSAADRAKLLVKGRGLNLPDWLDAAPLTPPVTVQLVNQANGLCWSGAFAAPSVNDAALFKAKAP